MKVKEKIIREELDKLLYEHGDGNNTFVGLTYIDGLTDALKWVLGEIVSPLDLIKDYLNDEYE